MNATSASEVNDPEKFRVAPNRTFGLIAASDKIPSLRYELLIKPAPCITL
jgi:hypothetical protein